MKNKFLLLILLALTSCASTKPETNDTKKISCYNDAPQFTKSIGIAVIQDWGKDLEHYYAFHDKLLKSRYTMQMQYQSTTTLISIDTHDGYNLSITQPSGWYIMSQHSSLIP